VQVPSDHHENPSDDIEGKTAHNSGDHSGDNYHGNCNSSNCNRNLGTGDDPKLMYDPGSDSLNTKDSASRNDDNFTSNNNSSGNVSCTADLHHSFDHDRDKTISTALDVQSILKFMQANCPISDVTSPHSTDKLPALLHRSSKDTDVVRRPLSSQHPAVTLDFDHS